MKLFFGHCVLLLCMMVSRGLYAQEGNDGFQKNDFYGAMASSKLSTVDKELNLLKTALMAGKNAYEGALLMKKAGLAAGPKNKLDLFKQGHKKLEAVIQKDSTNVEFRLLRLMVQEKSPGILGYKSDLGKDRLFIRNNFKKLPPVVQQAALDYSEGSKILKLVDL